MQTKDDNYVDNLSVSAGESESREVKEIKHKITYEETTNLLNDAVVIIRLGKSVYNNRAQISRRLNMLMLTVSIIFTMLYVAYMMFGGLFQKLSLDWKVAAYVIFSVYAVMLIILIVLAVIMDRNNTTHKVKKQGRALKYIRYLVRVSSLAMGIAALAISVQSGVSDTVGLAIDTFAIIVSIIFIILSAIPLLFGGFGGVAKWLLSPPKIRRRFSFVILEWYGLIVSDSKSTSKATEKVSIEYLDDIARCIDTVLIPVLGKKYMSAINIHGISDAVNYATIEDRDVVEGVLKNVFSYAAECGYVTENICKDLNLEGSIEEKPKEQAITKVTKSIGKSIGNKVKKSFSSFIKNIIEGNSDDK